MDKKSLKQWEDWYISQHEMSPYDDIDYFELGMSEQERQHYWKVTGQLENETTQT